MTLQDEFGNHPKEAFYGGAAGGGKSEALLMAAAQYVEVPGYAALLLRRTFPDLNQPGAILDRSKSWWTGKARWVEAQKAWHFPSGAVIKFGHLEHEKDKYDYQGAEYQFIGFDELTQFSEEMYTYLFSRLRRTTGLNVPLRMRAASNPGGYGHEWVKQRFIVEGPEHGRVFLPAGLADNPSLGPEYARMLDELDPITRAQLLEGNWDVSAGGASFKRGWFGVIDGEPVEFERIVRAWDTASTAPTENKNADWTVGVKMGRTSDGIFWILDIVRFQGTPRDVESVIRQTALADGVDVEIYMEQEPGASGKQVADHYLGRVLPEFYYQAIRATGKKAARAVPLSSQSQAGNVKIKRGLYLSTFFQEAEAFPYGPHDDQIDAASLAFNQLAGGGELRRASGDISDYFRWRS